MNKYPSSKTEILSASSFYIWTVFSSYAFNDSFTTTILLFIKCEETEGGVVLTNRASKGQTKDG